MNVELVKYNDDFKTKTLKRVARFFGFHETLITNDAPHECVSDAEEILSAWQKDSNRLFVILADGADVGFVRVQFRGDIVAWLEDIFVDEDKRGRGIATAAISEAEEIVKNTQGYKAMSLDVAPRNDRAMKIYHKLGYTEVSMLTLRKEFGESKRQRPFNLFGLEFKF